MGSSGAAQLLHQPGASGGWANLLTPNQASVETDATGWVANLNCTLSRSTLQFLDGAASLAIMGTAIGQSIATTTVGTGAVVPSQSYTAAFSVWAATVARTVRSRIDWYTAASGYISSTEGALIADTTTGWTAYTLTAVAPATAAFASVAVDITDVTKLAAEVHYVDRASLRKT